MSAFPLSHLELKEYLELHLLRFYSNIFQQELATTKKSTNLETFLQKLKKYYYKRIIKNEASVINFDSPQMRCSYIFHFAACFSSIVANYFSKFLHYLPCLTEKILLADEINICCLGGGPATEFVAIAKVLEVMLWRYCPRGDRPLKLKATVVDINPGWRKTVKKVSENLAHFLDTNLINYQLSFVHADLTKSSSDEVRNMLSCSDIVTMSKFMTTIHGTCGVEDVRQTLQEIMNHMDENGVIFYVNCSRFSCIKELQDPIARSTDTEVIYGPIYNDVYQLSQPCLRECYDLYARHFGTEPPTLQNKNHVVAWRKIVAIAQT